MLAERIGRWALKPVLLQWCRKSRNSGFFCGQAWEHVTERHHGKSWIFFRIWIEVWRGEGTLCKGWEEKISNVGWLRACRFSELEQTAYWGEEMSQASEGQVVGGTYTPSSGSNLFWCIMGGGSWSRTVGRWKASLANTASGAVWRGLESGGDWSGGCCEGGREWEE